MIKNYLTAGGAIFATGWLDIDSGLLVGILAIVTLAATTANQIKGVLSRRPTVNEEFSGIRKEFATKAEVNAIKNDVEKLEKEIRGEFAAQRDAAETRSVKLHDRINDVLREASKLSGKLEK